MLGLYIPPIAYWPTTDCQLCIDRFSKEWKGKSKLSH